MKKLFVFLVLILFFANFISATAMTGSAVNKIQENQIQANLNNDDSENQEEISITTQTQKRASVQEHAKGIIQTKNRLRLQDETGVCPEDCVCTGSATKCQIKRGREMIIIAGKSGNTIIQVKNKNMSTKVELYKNKEKLYGVFKGNKTREIKMMPDQVKSKIQEKLMLKDCDIELDENGLYQAQAQKRARLFGFIPVKERVKIQMDSETGEITKTKTSWWGFLAKDIKEAPILGASCGTVTPGENDACCQTKGYDIWNSEKSECLFE